MRKESSLIGYPRRHVFRRSPQFRTEREIDILFAKLDSVLPSSEFPNTNTNYLAANTSEGNRNSTTPSENN